MDKSNSRRDEDDALVVSRLQRVGITIESVFDLLNRKDDETAFPVLLQLLDEVQDPTIKQGVVRALSSKKAKDAAAPRLIEEFKKTDVSAPGGDSLKWAIGNAIGVLVSPAFAGQLFDIVTDRRHGIARQMIVAALGNLKGMPEVIPIVRLLLDDDEVCGHAAIAAANLGDSGLTPALERLAHSQRPAWVKKEALKALKKSK
jgi:HEAT repeat protein